MIWNPGESVINIDKDQISERSVCHARGFGFYSGIIGDSLKETI